MKKFFRLLAIRNVFSIFNHPELDSKPNIDLDMLNKEIDILLENSTEEELTKYLKNKRMQQRIKNIPDEIKLCGDIIDIIKTTLVIENKESIHFLQDKILKMIEKKYIITKIDS